MPASSEHLQQRIKTARLDEEKAFDVASLNTTQRYLEPSSDAKRHIAALV